MGCALPLRRAHPAHCHILKEQQTTPLTRTSCSLPPILDSTDAAGPGSSFFTLRPGVNARLFFSSPGFAARNERDHLLIQTPKGWMT